MQYNATHLKIYLEGALSGTYTYSTVDNITREKCYIGYFPYYSVFDNANGYDGNFYGKITKFRID